MRLTAANAEIIEERITFPPQLTFSHNIQGPTQVPGPKRRGPSAVLAATSWRRSWPARRTTNRPRLPRGLDPGIAGGNSAHGYNFGVAGLAFRACGANLSADRRARRARAVHRGRALPVL